MHRLIEEFCRVHSVRDLQPHFFARAQRTFRDEIAPALDERDRLLEENQALRAQVEKLQTKKKAATEAA